jgi:hypothetical protein
MRVKAYTNRAGQWFPPGARKHRPTPVRRVRFTSRRAGRRSVGTGTPTAAAADAACRARALRDHERATCSARWWHPAVQLTLMLQRQMPGPVDHTGM